jgi:hypothetical protein
MPEALADLGEYYYSAPGVVGGGINKAETVAAQLDRIDPARAHELRGNIAEQRKDYGTAERELKQAITASAHPAFQWMALAGFYRERQLDGDGIGGAQRRECAPQRDKQAGVALYNGASLLIETGRDPARAARMLEEYLAGSAKTEEGRRLWRMYPAGPFEGAIGRRGGASRERAAALALAQEYMPARDLEEMKSQDQKH